MGIDPDALIGFVNAGIEQTKKRTTDERLVNNW